jgi:hypothetical protein
VASLAAAATPPSNAGVSGPVEPGGATGGLFTGLNFARFSPGGTVGGLGVGDSIHAMLTPGEFVHRTAAVKHYGVDMMHAINSLQFPKFEIGGFVDRVSSSMTDGVPHFATGGLASSSSTTTASPTSVVNLHFPDQSFHNLQASGKTAEHLRNYALGRQISSAGPAPSWDGS